MRETLRSGGIQNPNRNLPVSLTEKETKMFCCTFNEFFGIAETPMMAYENMAESMELSVDEDSPDPRDCEFFEQIEVNITRKTIWDIQPQYEFEVEE